MEPNLRLLGGGDAGLELGLGLNIGSRPTCHLPEAKSPGPSCCRGKLPVRIDGAVSGTQRAPPDSVTRGMSQVVGWPPIRSYRMNSLVNHGKTPNGEGNKKEKIEENSSNKLSKGKNSDGFGVKESGNLGFVKVNMDGIPIGRKVDLSAHTSYRSLAKALVAMFKSATNVISSFCGLGGEKEQIELTPSMLLDGSSEFALTYEDKEGDWLLVGDVPWGMFVGTAKRLRILKTSEAKGLAPTGIQETHERRNGSRI